MMNKIPLLNWVLTASFLVAGLLWFAPWDRGHQLPPPPAVAPQSASIQTSSTELPRELPKDVAKEWTGDDQFVFLWRDTDMSNYVDRRAILRLGSIVKYGLITNFDRSITPVSSTTTLFTVDCMQRTVNVGLTRSYSHQFGSGELLLVSDLRRMGNSFEPWGSEMRHPQMLCALSQ